MTVLRPELYTAFGAIDSDAFEDGAPFSSHLLRSIAMNANRLAGKGHQMMNLVWPTFNTFDDSQGRIHTAQFHIGPFWRRIVPPLIVPKKPGLSTATVYVHAQVEGTRELLMQFVTRGTGPVRFNANSDDINVMLVSGDGDNDYDLYKMTLLPVERLASDELVEVWIRSVGQSAGADAAGGTPTSALFDELDRDYMRDDSASWSTGAASKWSALAHYIRFEDSAALPVTRPVEITDVTSATELEMKFLKKDELRLARTAGYYSIFSMGRIGLGQIALFADGRLK